MQRTPSSEFVRNRLLAVLTVVLAIGGLRASYAVTMPLAAAGVIIAGIWPVKQWLDGRVPTILSYIGTIIVLLILISVFVAAVSFCAAQVVGAFARDQQELQRIYTSASNWFAQFGLGEIAGAQGYSRIVAFGQQLLGDTYTVLVYVGYIAVLVILGLPQVPVIRSKLSGAPAAQDGTDLVDMVGKIAGLVREYLAVTALASAITGIASALWAWAMGLELAIVWGVLNFLLNFIPVIGSVVGIVPPTIYAIIQFGDLSRPLMVFAGFAALQIVISNFVYPILQGRRLALSPLAVLVSLAFWSWMWGVAGALIAVPLTGALVVLCSHFRSTGWIARLLSAAD